MRESSIVMLVSFQVFASVVSGFLDGVSRVPPLLHAILLPFKAVEDIFLCYMNAKYTILCW